MLIKIKGRNRHVLTLLETVVLMVYYQLLQKSQLPANTERNWYVIIIISNNNTEKEEVEELEEKEGKKQQLVSIEVNHPALIRFNLVSPHT